MTYDIRYRILYNKNRISKGDDYIQKANIEITEAELMKILSCIEDRKRKAEVKIDEYEKGLESGLLLNDV